MLRCWVPWHEDVNARTADAGGHRKQPRQWALWHRGRPRQDSGRRGRLAPGMPGQVPWLRGRQRQDDGRWERLVPGTLGPAGATTSRTPGRQGRLWAGFNLVTSSFSCLFVYSIDWTHGFNYLWLNGMLNHLTHHWFSGMWHNNFVFFWMRPKLETTLILCAPQNKSEKCMKNQNVKLCQLVRNTNENVSVWTNYCLK